jgi:serine/threonine protein kinase
VGCPAIEDLVDCAEGRASPDARDAVAAHASECAACRLALSELSRTGERANLAPGTRIGRFTLVEPLGRGAMGVVWSANDPELDRLVAVKVLRDDVEQLGNEGRALAQLAHPNVVPVFDAGVLAGRRYVVMELLRGPTLRRWLADPHGQREVLALLIAAGRGLAAVHRAGLEHRDFKPENIILDGDGRARVTDFGLARYQGSDESGGTRAYAAPEVIERQPSDARADQFAYCVVLCEALCGERPFSGTTREELVASMRRGPTFARKLPAWLRTALERGLSFDPTARWPTVTALLDELERAPRRRMRIGIAASITVTAGFVAWLASLHLPAPDRSCRIESRRLGAERFGARADDWVSARIGACEDAGATDAVRRARFTRRIACLDRWQPATGNSPGRCLEE